MYSGFTRRLASKYASAYRHDVEDLFQEGMLAIAETVNLIDQTKSIHKQDYFFKQQIKWAMLSYIAANHCDVKVNKNKFFDGHIVENAEENEMDVLMSGMNPEDLYILFEDKAVLDRIIGKFEDTLEERNDVLVWFNVIKTDEPWTTREMAKELGVSPKTITNIRRRLEDRFHEIYTGADDA